MIDQLSPAVDESSPGPTPTRGPRTRRAILAGALGGIGAWAAGTLTRVNPTQAAAGSNLIVGSSTNNAGTSNTMLTTSSSVVAFELLQNGPGTALMGYVTPASGTTRGVYGRTDSPSGDGVQARNAGAAGTGTAMRAFGGNNTGLVATTANGVRYAVMGATTSTADDAVAIYGEVSSTSPGTNSEAVRGVNNGTGEVGIGVFGYQAGSGYGVYGATPAGTAVYGISSTGYGVYGTGYTGVKGVSGDGFGVFGTSDSGNGVYGFSVSNYAGYFAGSLYADSLDAGSASAAVKAFRIDHPQDPAGKVLMHSCVESNERKLVYDGVVTTNAAGEATIKLAGYFSALNRDLRYQLTVIGTDARAWVKTEVKANRFTIATSEPGVEVCWQVTGVRADAYSNAHPLEVESAKSGREKGKYLNPVEHGQPKSAGVDYELRARAKALTPAAP